MVESVSVNELLIGSATIVGVVPVATTITKILKRINTQKVQKLVRWPLTVLEANTQVNKKIK